MFALADMRRDVQEIFRNTPHEKQVMMFSATLSKEIRPVCKKFMQDVITPLSHWPCSNGSNAMSGLPRHGQPCLGGGAGASCSSPLIKV